MKFNINNQTIEFTGQQATILKHLMNCHHRIVTFSEIETLISHGTNNPVRHDVQTVVSRVRNELKKINAENYIVTTRGVGYQWIPK